MEQIQENINLLEQMKASLSSDVTALQIKISAIDVSIDLIKNGYKSDVEAINAEIQKGKDLIAEDLASKETLIATLQNSLNDKTAEVDSLNATLEDKNMQINNLTPTE